MRPPELRPLRRLFSSTEGGSWGANAGEADVDLPCIRGTDFDYPHLRSNVESAPLRSYSRVEVGRRAAHAGDVIIEKSGGGENQPVGRAVLHVGGPVMPTNFAGLLRPAPDTDPQFVTYLLASRYSDGRTRSAIKQSTGIQNLDLGRFLSEHVPCPRLGAQRAIAAYLDTETSRIDALMAKKRSLSKLVQQASAASLEESVSASAPSAWVIHLGQVLERIIDYRGATPEKIDQGIPLITASNVVDGQVRLDLSRQFVSEETYRSWMQRGLPQEGDLLITTEAPLGQVAMYPDHRAALAQRIVLLRPRLDLVRPDFLYCYLRSASGRADLLSRASGSTVTGVRTDRLREVAVVVPTLEAQDEIVRRNRAAQSRERDLTKRLADQCALLEEHRQALITAAVTGELEIPGVAS